MPSGSRAKVYLAAVRFTAIVATISDADAPPTTSNADEVLDLFSRKFEADNADAQSKDVATDSSNPALDPSKAFEPTYVSKPAASPQAQG